MLEQFVVQTAYAVLDEWFPINLVVIGSGFIVEAYNAFDETVLICRVADIGSIEGLIEHFEQFWDVLIVLDIVNCFVADQDTLQAAECTGLYSHIFTLKHGEYVASHVSSHQCGDYVFIAVEHHLEDFRSGL